MKGRCAGCGETGKTLEIMEHIRYCPKFLELYRQDPSRALHPEEEFVRWQSEDRPAERERHREDAIAEADRRRAVQADRWQTPPDILEGLWLSRKATASSTRGTSTCGSSSLRATMTCLRTSRTS